METTPLDLLTKTRALTFAAAFLLSLQFYGNLYEQNTAIRNVVDPVPGDSVPALSAGSPLFFYMPWVLVGIVLLAILIIRVRGTDLAHVRRDLWIAVGCIAIAAAAKTVLVTQVNDQFRDPTATTQQLISAGWVWLAGNGITVIASGATLWFLLRWRSRIPALITTATSSETRSSVPTHR